ncbi:MAG: acyl dehydratase, partial [bacterium]|nr:acyl dehydratase [bacterium]
PFWEALTRHEVQIQQCASCQAWIYYPRAFCPECLSPELEWKQISGKGTLYSFTIARRPTAPFWADEVPQLIVVVELDEGPRLTSTLCNIEEADIRVGMRLRPVFDDIAGKDVTLLRYESQ